ncbi:MAG TPA: CAP domain-containing protein [Rhodobiaceae bacterium]|nr:CAP domain-containing protein [Rhodobiaceae bacterium]
MVKYLNHTTWENLMQRLYSIASLVMACAFLAACSSGRPGEPAPLRSVGLPQQAASSAVSDTPLGRAVARAVNDYRSAAPLAVNSTLQRAAAVHASDMAIRNYAGHHNPEGQGPVDRVLAIDENYQRRIGETIWMGQVPAGRSDAQIAAMVINAWSNSPRHRTIVEASRNSQIGVGTAQKGDAYYVVAVFSD